LHKLLELFGKSVNVDQCFQFPWIAVVLLMLFIHNSQGIAQTAAASPGTPKHLKLRLVNGKSGSAIWWRGSPFVYVGSSNVPIQRHTNLFGEEMIDISATDTPTIQVWVDFISKDCRSKDFSRVHETYSITEILKAGVVSPNYCGTSQAKPRPGVLVIYVVPSTLKELWNQ
jgi:hypothetical protein